MNKQLEQRLKRLETTLKQQVLKLAGKAVGQPVDVVKPAPMPLNLAGSVALWYWQDGLKHFVMVRNTKQANAKASLRFPSFYGLLPKKDAAATLAISLQYQLGEKFMKKLDKFQLSFANVSAAPTFFWQNETTQTEETVQMLLWQQEIDAKWLKLIKTPEGMETQTIPDFAMTGKRIAPAHQLIFKNLNRAMEEMDKAERLLHEIPEGGQGASLIAGDEVIEHMDQLDDLMEEMYDLPPKSSRILH